MLQTRFANYATILSCDCLSVQNMTILIVKARLRISIRDFHQASCRINCARSIVKIPKTWPISFLESICHVLIFAALGDKEVVYKTTGGNNSITPLSLRLPMNGFGRNALARLTANGYPHTKRLRFRRHPPTRPRSGKPTTRAALPYPPP